MSATAAIDTLMDRSLVLGYGNVGMAVRRRLPGWPADPPRMDDQVVLVTGAGAGIGLAAAEGFLRLGASVRALARSDARAGEAVAELQRRVPGGDVQPAVCDVSSLKSLRSFATGFIAREERLDVLVNNAGVMPPERALSKDGIELSFATNVLGPFVLIDLLGDLLRASAPARVITVSSGGMYGQSLHADDLQMEHVAYGPTKAYARAKRAQVVITEQWAKRLDGSGVVVHAMHPGWVATEGVASSLPTFGKVARPILRTPQQGADTIVWLGGSPVALESTGGFWHDRRRRPTHYLAGASKDSLAAREALWATCVALSGSGDLAPAPPGS